MSAVPPDVGDEAVEVAAVVIAGGHHHRLCAGPDDDCTCYVKGYRDKARAALTAAAPHLTADAITAERERIAAAIERFFPDPHGEHEGCDDCIFMRQAARIARAGGQP